MAQQPGLVSLRFSAHDLLSEMKNAARESGGDGGRLVAKSCPALCDPTDCSLLGSSVHGISQARILEWVAISFCRESSQPGDQTRVSCLGS